MKRFRSLVKIAALSLALGWLTACTPSATPTALAPGYLNSADQQMGEILAGARSFYTSIQQQSAAGTLTLTATVKQDFNTFGGVLNGAEAAYLTYHQTPNPTTQAAAQSAVNQVQSQQAALSLPGAKVTP